VHTLNLLRRVVDLRADATGQQRLDFVRTYNSRFSLDDYAPPDSVYGIEDTRFAIFGPAGWTHNYNLHLYVRGIEAVFIDGDGEAGVFSDQLDYDGPSGVFHRARSADRSAIRKIGTDHYRLLREDGSIVEFDRRVGAAPTGFAWSHFVPSRVIGPDKSVLSFEHHLVVGDSRLGMVARVADESGRALEFVYDEGLLVYEGGSSDGPGVIDPENPHGIEGGDFGGGGGGSGAAVSTRGPMRSLLTSVRDPAGRRVRFAYAQRAWETIEGVEPLFLAGATIEDENEVDDAGAPVHPPTRIEVSRYTYADDETPNHLLRDDRLLTAGDRNGPPNHPAVRYAYPAEVRGEPVSFLDPTSPTYRLARGAITREENLHTGSLIVDVAWPANETIDDVEYERRIVSRPSNQPASAAASLDGTPVDQKTVYYLAPKDEDGDGVFTPNNNLPVRIVDFDGSETTRSYASYPTPPSGETESYSTRQLTEGSDRLGRETRHEYQDGSSFGAKSSLTATVHPDGTRTRWTYFLPLTSQPRWLIGSITDTLGRTTSYDYLQRASGGRTNLVTRIDHPDGSAEFWNYGGDPETINAGLPVSYTDRAGRGTGYSYVFEGPEPGGAIGWMRQVTATDAVGRETITARDILGRVVRVVSPGDRTTTYRYNIHGDLIEQTLPDGSRVEFAYDATLGVAFDPSADSYYLDPASDWLRHRGNISVITEYPPVSAQGPPTVRTLTYDAFNRIRTSTLHSGKGIHAPETTELRYEIEALPDLISPPGGACCGSGIGGGDAAVRTIIRPDGQRTDFAYDALGRPFMRILPDLDGDGVNRAFESRSIDAVGQIRSATDATGAQTLYHYDVRGRVYSIERVNDGASGNPSQVVLLRHDAGGRVTHRADYAAYPADLPAYRQAYEDWAAARGDHPDAPAPAFPAGARITSIEHQEVNGNPRNDWVTAIVDPEGGRTEFEYDAVGNRTAIIDARGNRTEFDHDDVDRLRRLIHPDTNADGVRAESSWSFDPDTPPGAPPEDRVIVARDEVGAETRFVLDDRGRIASVENPVGEYVEFEYDHLGNQTLVRDFPDGPGDAGSPNLGREWRVEYDAQSRPVRVEGPDERVNDFVYDASGRLVRWTDYPNGPSTLGRSVSYVYDALDRLVEIRRPDASVERFEHDLVGRVTGRIDQDARAWEYVYDALGQPIAEISPLHDPGVPGAFHITSFEWDGAGRLTAVVDANAARTEYEYDSDGRTTTIRYAAGTTDQTAESFVYDPVGNLQSVTLRDAGVWSLVYDERNRLVSTTATEPDRGPTTDTFLYDEAGRLTSASSGRYASVANFSYDLAGRLVTETQYHDSYLPLHEVSTSTSYAYNLAGELVELGYPGGERARFSYTARGELDLVDFRYAATEPWSRIADHTYDKAGQLTRRVLGDPTVSASSEWFSYDAQGRVESVLHSTSDAPAGAFIHWLYERTPAGDATRRDDLMSVDLDEVYEYDDAHRLISWDRFVPAHPSEGRSQDWDLDPLGNWRSFTDDGVVETRDHSPLNTIESRSIDALGSLAVEHDARGRVVADAQGLRYEWDGRDRLVRVLTDTSPPAVIESYTYDALGRRIARERSEMAATPDLMSGTTIFAYAGLQCIEERTFAPSDDQTIDPSDPFDTGGSDPRPLPLSPQINPDIKAIYIFGAGLDEPLAMERWSPSFPGATRYFHHRDHLGSIVALTTPSASGDAMVAERVEYTPYGGVRTWSATFTDPRPWSRVGNPHLFTAQRQDPATGLHHFKARYQHPALGRFLSPDPLGYVDGFNMHEYVGSMPTAYTDPLGLNKREKLTPFQRDVREASKRLKRGSERERAEWEAIWGKQQRCAPPSAPTGPNPGGGAGGPSTRRNGPSLRDPVFDRWRPEYDQIEDFEYTVRTRQRAINAVASATKQGLQANANPTNWLFTVSAVRGFPTPKIVFFGALGKTARQAAAPSSRKLARALEAAGQARPPGAATHHIVAGRAQKAEPARAALERFGIGIDDAANGMFLPSNVHQRIHTDAYYKAVNAALTTANTRAEALEALSRIRQRLSSGGRF